MEYRHVLFRSPRCRATIEVRKAMALLTRKSGLRLKRLAVPLTRARRRAQSTPALAWQERPQRKFPPRMQELAGGQAGWKSCRRCLLSSGVETERNGELSRANRCSWPRD